MMWNRKPNKTATKQHLNIKKLILNIKKEKLEDNVMK